MGVIVVVKVREKGGAVPGPWVHIRKALPKGSVHNRHPIVPENPSHMVRTAHPCTNSRLRMAAGRVRRAHHATTAKHLQPISLPAAYILGGVRTINTSRAFYVRTFQRHQNGVDPSPGGVLFFACPKKRTKRKGSPAAETTPVDGLRNRRGKNSLRSNSLPLFPGSAPRRPAQRQRAVPLPRKPALPRTTLLAGPAFHLAGGDSEGIVPTLQRGIAAPDAPASACAADHQRSHSNTIAGMARSYRKIRHLR